MSAEHDDRPEPEDKRKPPYLKTGKLAPGWQSNSRLSDLLPSVDAMNKRLVEQLAQIAGVPRFLFEPPIDYTDPYPEIPE